MDWNEGHEKAQKVQKQIVMKTFSHNLAAPGFLLRFLRLFVADLYE